MRGGFRLGLLWCGHVDRDALDLGGDYPALFDELFSPLGAQVQTFAVDEGEFPASLSDCDGWITSPAWNSVNDADPWIAQLRDLIAELVHAERPFAGICFGHQLLATVLGGRVERADSGWGVGVQTYEIVAPRWWMSPPSEPESRQFRLVASHEDQVTEIPRDATVLATASYCPVAAMEVGDRAISIQPHPEFSVALSERLLDLRAEMIGIETVAAARASLATTPDRELVAHWIMNFLRNDR